MDTAAGIRQLLKRVDIRCQQLLDPLKLEPVVQRYAHLYAEFFLSLSLKVLVGCAILTIARIFTSEFFNHYGVNLGQSTSREICRRNPKSSYRHVSILQWFFTTLLDEV